MYVAEAKILSFFPNLKNFYESYINQSKVGITVLVTHNS